MSRKSTKLPFDADHFESLLQQHSLTKGQFAEKIKEKYPDSQLSLVTLHNNLNEKAASRDNLIHIAKFFSLNPKQFKHLMGEKPLPVFFRRERIEAVEEHAKDLIRDISELYFSIRPFAVKKRPIATFKNLNEMELANEIRRVLNLPHGKISYDEVVNALEEFGIHVHFYPFEYLGIEQKKTKNYRAASVCKNGNWLILLDTSNTLEYSLFDLFHELAHIFSDHDMGSTTPAEEKYCNNVAAEILTPSAFFNEYRDYLTSSFRNPSTALVGQVGFIQDALGASFESIIYALSKANLISSEVKNYLFACLHRMKRDFKTIYEDLGLDKKNAHDWALNLKQDRFGYLSFFRKFKSAYLTGNFSSRAVGSVFALPIEESDELCRIWNEELNVSQDEVEQAVKDDEIWQKY